MVKPQALKRSSVACIPKPIGQSTKKIAQVPLDEENAIVANMRGKNVRRVVCARNNDINTSSSCVICNKPICIKRMKNVCEECLH